MASVNRRVQKLGDKVFALERKVRNLRAENAVSHLTKEQVFELEQKVSALEDEVRYLRAENAKLSAMPRTDEQKITALEGEVRYLRSENARLSAMQQKPVLPHPQTLMPSTNVRQPFPFSFGQSKTPPLFPTPPLREGAFGPKVTFGETPHDIKRSFGHGAWSRFEDPPNNMFPI